MFHGENICISAIEINSMRNGTIIIHSFGFFSSKIITVVVSGDVDVGTIVVGTVVVDTVDVDTVVVGTVVVGGAVVGGAVVLGPTETSKFFDYFTKSLSHISYLQLKSKLIFSA